MSISEEVGIKMLEGITEYPEEMFCSFCSALMKDVDKDYREFIDGLDLTEDESAFILKGFLERKLVDWKEDAEDSGIKVLNEFDRILLEEKKNKRRNKL
jgi:hypothetical protein